MSKPLVELDRVSVTIRGATILRDVCCAINAGERIAVLGANGAGKSSLLRVIHRLLSADSGGLSTVVAREQAMIFQRPVLLKRSVLDNIIFPLRARAMPEAQARDVARRVLHDCGLDALADHYARTLSGGEQQQLALARAWALSPCLLLADEPTASLAPAAVHAVEKILYALSAHGTTLVFATHNRGQAKRLATRILFMHEGRIIEDRSATDFFDAPQSSAAIEYLADSIGRCNTWLLNGL
jgi:tungstate transport system ATP-binding protein